jgi:hypothetical protein
MLILLFIGTGLKARSQNRSKNDFSTWYWAQVEKDISKKQTIGFQYQVRFNQNSTRFNSSNFYFNYTFSAIKNWNTELLYQLSTHYKKDSHTLYFGNTFKTKLNKKVSLFTRTAVQYSRNSFTGLNKLDKPSTEWRNRFRLAYRINPSMNITLSAEPYLRLRKFQPPNFSKIRFVSQCTLRYNKFQDFSLFYMVQPDVAGYGSSNTHFVLGFTNTISLPSSLKKMKKLYHSTFLKHLKREKLNTEMKDTFH